MNTKFSLLFSTMFLMSGASANCIYQNESGFKVGDHSSDFETYSCDYRDYPRANNLFYRSSTTLDCDASYNYSSITLDCDADGRGGRVTSVSLECCRD